MTAVLANVAPAPRRQMPSPVPVMVMGPTVSHPVEQTEVNLVELSTSPQPPTFSWVAELFITTTEHEHTSPVSDVMLFADVVSMLLTRRTPKLLVGRMLWARSRNGMATNRAAMNANTSSFWNSTDSSTRSCL